MNWHNIFQILFIFFLIFKMCDCDYNRSMDMKTPRNVSLSAFYKRSFAFHTVKNRMPIILTHLIDGLVRSKEEIGSKRGTAAKEELKTVIGLLSKLKYEIQTNKPLYNLTSNSSDVEIYNDYINKQSAEKGPPTHFHTIWLLTECYMYRRIREAFELTKILQDYDPFQNQKQDAYFKAYPLISKLGQYLLDIIRKEINEDKYDFISLLKLNLWGNKCDLSISLGKVEGNDTLFDTASLQTNVLSDFSEEIWKAVSVKENSSDIIDIVFDNSGYELFTDLCLADFLISKQYASKIRLYVKTIPWFISDVMTPDLQWTINQLINSDEPHLQKLGKRWKDYLENETWTVVENEFWTLPFEFKFMSETHPDLYRQLSEAKLAIFKGDLNYRKLFGEINWDPTTPIDVGLQDFNPTKLCILRTIKADIVCGLEEGIAEKTEAKDPKWMETGDYGLIQFSNKIVPLQD